MVIGYLPPLTGYTQYTPVVPQFYWDAHSNEERIKHLSKEYDRLCHYASKIAEKTNCLDEHKASKKELCCEIRKLTAKNTELKRLIDELQTQELQWDCQHGYLTNTIDAQRDMFNDVTVHSISCERLADLDITCAELSECGLSVRGLAVMSSWLVYRFCLPEDQRHHEPQNPKLTIEQIDNAEVLSDGTIIIPEEFRYKRIEKMTETSYYDLPLYEDDDQVDLVEGYNAAMELIDSALHTIASTAIHDFQPSTSDPYINVSQLANAKMTSNGIIYGTPTNTLRNL